MPTLDLSDLNISLSVLGIFIVSYGFISVKIKQKWYLGEALPAVLVGILLKPTAALLLDNTTWDSGATGEQNQITLGVMRVMIGVQLVIAGYQLPAKYQMTRWLEMLICLLPVMTTMWLCTTLCVILTVPKVSLLASLVIGSCVTCTDPVISQGIAKGPFADKYVARPLREIISSEAGANDGFGFPFLMLAVYLMRYSEVPEHNMHHAPGSDSEHARRNGEVTGRLGGGVRIALQHWGVETWLYTVVLSVIYGAIIGYGSGKVMRFALRRKWVDSESYFLFPTAMGLLLVGTCGAIGTDDQLACFVAGNCINWDGEYLEETEKRHNDVNPCVDVLLNFFGFMYIGTIIPWSEFHQPEGSGITIPRLMGLGFLVLIFRRIPAILMAYRFMPKVCRNVKEALFMGYFGPIGVGAVFYLEHTRIHLFPPLGKGDQGETDLIRAIGPVVYWLVLFSIVVHGLSTPILDFLYRWYGVRPIQDDAIELKRESRYIATPPNATNLDQDTFIAYNRFYRPTFNRMELPVIQHPTPPPEDFDPEIYKSNLRIQK